MRQRFVTLMGVAAIGAFIAVPLVPVAAGQAPTAGSNSAAGAPKTAWGEPDLQGIWTDEFQIPMQRPAKYAGREFFTDAEVAELEKQRTALPGNEARSVRGTEEDLAGAYNAVFQFRRHTGRRTSLIVDPPDGRIPQLTPEVQQRNREWREFYNALVQNTNTCKNNARGCRAGSTDRRRRGETSRSSTTPRRISFPAAVTSIVLTGPKSAVCRNAV